MSKFKVYETRGSESVATYTADTLQEAVDIIAREANSNEGTTFNGNNQFRLTELTERSIPINIINRDTSGTVRSTRGNITVTA